jgi:hypothetical protein
MFDQNLIANILSLTLFVIPLFIALRALFLFLQARNRRVFILGLSLGIIALTALADLMGDNVTIIHLSVKWFVYIGQTASFLFILLSMLSSADDYQQLLVRWHLVTCALLLILFLLAPVLPSDFPNPTLTKLLLGGSRGLICGVLFFYYVSAFMTKETRFSLLMSGAFLVLSVGYILNIPKYILSASIVDVKFLDSMGDTTRVSGLIILLIATLLG